MEEKIDLLLDEFTKIKQNLEPQASSRFEKTVQILEKLAVPVLIGLLAWFGSATNAPSISLSP